MDERLSKVENKVEEMDAKLSEMHSFFFSNKMGQDKHNAAKIAELLELRDRSMFLGKVLKWLLYVILGVVFFIQGVGQGFSSFLSYIKALLT